MDYVSNLNRQKESEHWSMFRYGDHYEWNKVVTCIHNVLSQQRYLEHYGEATIRNLNSSVCTCKITFVKVRVVFESSFLITMLKKSNHCIISWSYESFFSLSLFQSRYWGSDANKNEVQGQVLDQCGKVVHRFGGFWHEGIFCDTLPNPQCIWKPCKFI